MTEAVADNWIAGEKGDGVVRPVEDSQARMLADLYERHYEPIFRYCVHRLFDRTVAEDVVGAVFLDAARFDPELSRPRRGRVPALVVRHRDQSYRNQHPHNASAASPAAAGRRGRDDSARPRVPAPTDGPDWPSVWRAIQTLGRDEQTILTLRFFENLDFAAISAIVGKRETALRTMLCRSLKKIRTQLKSVFDGDR